MQAVDPDAVDIEMRYVLLGEPGVYRSPLDESRPTSDLMWTIKARHTAIQCKWWQLELYLTVLPKAQPANSVAATDTSNQGALHQRPRYFRAEDLRLQTLQTPDAARLVSYKSALTRPEPRLTCTRRLASWFISVDSTGGGREQRSRGFRMLGPCGRFAMFDSREADRARVTALLPADKVRLVVVDSEHYEQCAAIKTTNITTIMTIMTIVLVLVEFDGLDRRLLNRFLCPFGEIADALRAAGQAAEMDEVLLAVKSSDALVARLVAFCDQHDVEGKYQAFYSRHANAFDGAGDSEDEKSHEIHQLFLEYEELFEDTIQTFLDVEEISPEDFYAHCRTLLASPRQEDAATNLQILLSALDLDAFCALMAAEAVETQRARKAAEDMGL